MTGRARDVIHTSEASGSPLTRREYELRELVDELQAQLAERERIHELEIVAQRRQLEVRFAFESTLEKRLLEYQHRLEQSYEEVDVQRRIAAELAAEREQVAEAVREREEVVRVLDAERRRISYRAMQSVVVQVKKRRIVFGVVRRAARVIEARQRSRPLHS